MNTRRYKFMILFLMRKDNHHVKAIDSNDAG
jgi:hypothetical protein